MDLSDLNPEQLQAVRHQTGPLLVVAGAGTGKTQVITRRIARLIDEHQAEPGQILALTFTEKAAREMAERLYDLVGWPAFEIPVMTFHAFGSLLLGQYASHIGRSIRGGLLNDTQKTLLLLQHFDEVKLQYYGIQADVFEFLEGIVGYINDLQNAGISLENYRKYVDQLAATPGEVHPQAVAEQIDLLALYQLYEQIKAKTGTYDYHDQLDLPLRVLREHPNVTQQLGEQYHYVLVDEYQDTNLAQDELLRSFIGPNGNIFAVGDDDQAIYSFRGAEIGNILSFADHYQLKQPAVLVQNYRSGQAILDAAYRLIRHNDPDRLEVKLHLNKHLLAQTERARIEFQPYASQSDELEGVRAAIEARLKSGQPVAEIAVLATSRGPIKALAKQLRASGVPFAISAETDIFEQPELKQLWYLLEWLGGRASDDSIGHIIMGSFIGWKAAWYRPVVERARDQLVGAEEALRQLAEDDPRAQELVDRLDQWREWGRTLPVSRLAYQLVFETGLSDRLIAHAAQSDRIVRVFEDLGRLLGQMQDYETVAIDSTLSGYLAIFPQPPAIETYEAVGEAEGVQLLTVHAAKGLEFEVVYLINCTQAAWSPTNRGQRYVVPEELKTVAELPPEHEYRRLMYVAATRAKADLILSAPKYDAAGRRVTTARFVEELVGHSVPEFETETSSDLPSPKSAAAKLQRFYPLKGQYEAKRLPFETPDGWLELGVGAMDRYQQCPHEFYLQYVLGISQPFGPQLAFGTAIHRVIQMYYEARLRGESITLEQLEGRLAELWNNRGYESKALAEAAQDRARRAISWFYTREESQPRQIMATELKTVLELPEAKLRLKGRIDATFETGEGVEIRDFKTGMIKDQEAIMKRLKDSSSSQSFQSRTYTLAYQGMTKQTVAKVTLDYVVAQLEESLSFSPKMLANHTEKLVGLAERIRQRDFAPTPPSLFHHCAATTYYSDMEEDEASDATAG